MDRRFVGEQYSVRNLVVAFRCFECLDRSRPDVSVVVCVCLFWSQCEYAAFVSVRISFCFSTKRSSYRGVIFGNLLLRLFVAQPLPSTSSRHSKHARTHTRTCLIVWHFSSEMLFFLHSLLQHLLAMCGMDTSSLYRSNLKLYLRIAL